MKTTQERSADVSRRQREMLSAIGRGESSKETAARLGLSSRTVEEHKRRLRKVLGVRSSLDAILEAVKRRVVRVAELTKLRKTKPGRGKSKNPRR